MTKVGKGKWEKKEVGCVCVWRVGREEDEERRKEEEEEKER